MTRNTKLELTWPGKDPRARLDSRILIEGPAKSFAVQPPARGLLNGTDGAAASAGTFDNMLIKADDSIALKALEAGYAGQNKCAFIVPRRKDANAMSTVDRTLNTL